MSRLNQILIIVATLAAIMLFGAINKIRKQRQEISRLDGNIEAINTEARRYRTTAGDYAEQARRLSLEKSELELFNADLNNKVRELGIKNKELQGATRTETITKIVTIVKTFIDSSGVRRTANYNDGWNVINVESLPDSTKVDVHVSDTLDIITHAKQKKFLFFRIGRPKLYTTVSNKNPRSEMKMRFSATFD